MNTYTKYPLLFLLVVAGSMQAMERKLSRAQQKYMPQAKTSQNFYEQKPMVEKFDDITIQWAAGHGHYDTVQEWLIDSPSIINNTDKRGETALHWAASNNQKKVVELLLQQPKVQINARNNKGQTPLAWASYKGHTDIVQLLLDAGANPELGGVEGKTPFQWASGAGKLEIMKLLFGTKKCLINQKDTFGQTALHWAVWGLHTKAVEQLLAWNADCNTTDNNETTPLMRVTQKASVLTQKDVVAIIQLLLKHGANPSLKNKFNESAADHVVNFTKFISENNRTELLDLLSLNK
ncbi:MAG: ankyrin repeat domain-containing protein [Candidatus Babeliales bacterium]